MRLNGNSNGACTISTSAYTCLMFQSACNMSLSCLVNVAEVDVVFSTSHFHQVFCTSFSRGKKKPPNLLIQGHLVFRV